MNALYKDYVMAGAKTVITKTITTSQNIFQIKSKNRKYASFVV